MEKEREGDVGNSERRGRNSERRGRNSGQGTKSRRKDPQDKKILGNKKQETYKRGGESDIEIRVGRLERQRQR
jgi:hypothetical protein